MKLIVGLGNPGKKYEHTRHNVGFMVLDNIKKSIGLDEFCENKQFLTQLVLSDSQELGKTFLAKPDTFMNNSGQAVRKIVDYFKIAPEDLWIVSDDVNLKIGEIRIRKNGASGGHNGLQSIIDNIKSENFVRIRVGIGLPKESYLSLEDYVLQKFLPQEKKEIKKVIDKTVKFVISSLSSGKIEEQTIKI